MRLLLVTRGFPPAGRWGSEGYAHDLARRLAGEGHRVDVLVAHHGVSRVREVAENLRVFELGLARRPGKPLRDSYRDPRQDAYAARLCAKEGPYDRLHLCALGGGVSLGIVPALRPSVGEVQVTLTEFLPLCHRGQLLDAALRDCAGPAAARCSACLRAPGPFGEGEGALAAIAKTLLFPFGRLTPLASPAAFSERERFVAGVLALVDVFFAPSRALLERYVELGVPRDRLRYRPYELDSARYARYTPLPKSEPIELAFLGQLAPHKGCHVLLEAMARLAPEERARLRLTLRGAPGSRGYPGYMAALDALAARCGASVVMPGPFPPDEVDLVLSKAHWVVLPSLWLENLPLVLLHARACAVPVLGSRVGGIAEFVDEGVNGILVEPDPASWASSLRRLDASAPRTTPPA